jgi:uncharacterized protein YgbK (DUF1537 family)
MIAVLADDLSGAAELAGISLRYGLRTELFTSNITTNLADVVVLSTDSRSLKKEDALSVTRQALEQVLELNPHLIYKKIDSVLRGHVLDELHLQMQMMKKKRALVLPANPSLGRTIRDGKYFIDDIPIHETAFSSDPEFPATAADIRTLLQTQNHKPHPAYSGTNHKHGLHVLRCADPLPPTGIIIGEATDEADISAWAEQADDSFVLAGAGDFFNELLHRRFRHREQDAFQVETPFLYVCGTSYDRSVSFVNKAFEKQQPVLFIKEEMLDPEEMNINGEVNHFIKALQRHQKGIIAFEKELEATNTTAEDLRAIMATTVKWVLGKNSIKELLIEGGSTATAVLQELNIRHLQPSQELKRGVLRMKSDNMYITIKPGSYEMPDAVIKLFS